MVSELLYVKIRTIDIEDLWYQNKHTLHPIHVIHIEFWRSTYHRFVRLLPCCLFGIKLITKQY